MIAILIVLCLSLTATAFVPSMKSFRGIQKSSLSMVVLNPKNRDESKIMLPPKQMRSSRKTKKDAAKEEGKFFGFSKTAEMFNGRMAMSFFVYGIYQEMTTGKSILQQIGLVNKDQQVDGFVFAILFSCMALYPSITKLFTKLSSSELTEKDPEF